MKRACGLTLVMILVVITFPLLAYAQEVHPSSSIVPYWNWTLSIQNVLDISNTGRAKCQANIITNKADKVEIVADLQQKSGSSWKTLKSWTKTENKPSAALSGSYYVEKNYYYRLKTTFYVYSGGELKETITDTYNYGYYD